MAVVRRDEAGRLILVAALSAAVATPALTASAQTECGVPPGSEPCPVWTARHESPSGSGAAGIVAAPDGSAVFVGGVGPEGVTVISYETGTGAERWTASYGAGSEGAVEALAISPDGRTLFVTGPSVGAANDYLTTGLEADTGRILWTVRLDGTGLDDYPWDVAVSHDAARVYVTGYLDEGPSLGARNFVTVAYDAGSGAELWRARYDGPAHSGEVARALATGIYEDPEGGVRERVFITGRSNGPNAGAAENDYATVAYDGETGAILWEARYDGPARGRDYPIDLALSPDRAVVYVTGESTDATGGFDYATVAYDAATGTELWVTRLERADDQDAPLISSSTDVIGAVTASPSGDRVYVTGYGAGREQPFDRTALTFALDAVSGTEIWSASRTGPLGEVGHDILVSPDDADVYVAGQAGLAGGGIVTSGNFTSSVAGYLSVAYDESGTEEWSARYGMLGSDATYSDAAISPDGSLLFLTGTEYGDFQTVAYRI